jgi:hypothetical protein
MSVRTTGMVAGSVTENSSRYLPAGIFRRSPSKKSSSTVTRTELFHPPASGLGDTAARLPSGTASKEVP